MAPPDTTEKGWQKCWYSWREWLSVWSAKNKALLNEGNQCKTKSNITQSPHHNATKTDDRNRGREAQQCNKNNKTQRINNNWREGQWVKANRTAGKTGDTRLLNQNMKQSRTNADRKHSSIPSKSQYKHWRLWRDARLWLWRVERSESAWGNGRKRATRWRLRRRNNNWRRSVIRLVALTSSWEVYYISETVIVSLCHPRTQIQAKQMRTSDNTASWRHSRTCSAIKFLTYKVSLHDRGILIKEMHQNLKLIRMISIARKPCSSNRNIGV